MLDRFSHVPERSVEVLNVIIARLDRATADEDVELIIGTSKELIESTSKVILDSLGLVPTGDSLNALATQSLDALGLHANAIQGREPLRKLLGSLGNLPGLIAEIRNTDGTGHGRLSVSDLRIDSAIFMGQVAPAWSEWSLGALDRALESFEAASEAAEEIERGRIFHRGELWAFLEELEIDSLETDAQRRLGLAVGRRAASGTFIVDSDVLAPLGGGGVEFPRGFVHGLLEGLFIDSNGRVRSLASAVREVASISRRVDGGEAILQEIAEAIATADCAYAFDEQSRSAVSAELREQTVDSGSSDPDGIDVQIGQVADSLYQG